MLFKSFKFPMVLQDHFALTYEAHDLEMTAPQSSIRTKEAAPLWIVCQEERRANEDLAIIFGVGTFPIITFIFLNHNSSCCFFKIFDNVILII